MSLFRDDSLLYNATTNPMYIKLIEGDLIYSSGAKITPIPKLKRTLNYDNYTFSYSTNYLVYFIGTFYKLHEYYPPQLIKNSKSIFIQLACTGRRRPSTMDFFKVGIEATYENTILKSDDGTPTGSLQAIPTFTHKFYNPKKFIEEGIFIEPQDIRLKVEFWETPPESYHLFTDQDIEAWGELLDPDTDNGDIMPDSEIVKRLAKQVALLSDWMGVAQQPDGTTKIFPDPYHVESVSDNKIKGLQFAAFGKGSPTDTFAASVVEVISNRVEKDKLGNPTIKDGGYVKVFNLPQALMVRDWDFGKALGIQESGGIAVPKGDNSGTVIYQSQLAMQVDQLYTISRMTKSVNELVIQAARSQAQLQSLLAATGCTLISQKIPFDINGKTGYAEVGVIHPNSTTILGDNGVIKANIAALLGANLTSEPTLSNFN